MSTRFIVSAVVGTACATGAATAIAAGLSESKKTVPVAFNEQKTVVAKCPGTKYIAFGGFKGTVNDNISQAATKVYTFGMVPEGPDADRMAVDADNGSPPGTDNAKITAFAYCAEGRKPRITTDETTVATDDDGSASAACPEGKTVVGGGFETSFVNTQGPHMTILFLGRGTGESFQVEIFNTMSDESIDLTAYAVCGRGNRPQLVTGPNKPLDDGDPTKTKASCPGNDKVVFGGVTGEYDFSGFAMPTAMYRDGEAIEVIGAGNTGSEYGIRALAYCR